MAMPLAIVSQFSRLNLSDQWKITIERYIKQFESGYERIDLISDHDESVSAPNDSGSVTVNLISDALAQINPETDDRTKRRLFGEAIAKLPVFYLRLKVSVDGKDQFWDPLVEDVPSFLTRTDSSARYPRLYTAQTPLFGEDVISSRVFSDLISE